jgi:hypothetical protein
MSDKEQKNNIDFKGFEEFEPYDTSNPEKELLRAILVGALNDVKKKGYEKRKATEFFLSPEDDYIFSFLSICDFLRVNPNKVLVVAGLKESTEGENVTKLKKELFKNWD